MKIVYFVSLFVIFSLIWSQANADPTGQVIANSHKANAKLTNKTPMTSKNGLTDVKSATNKLTNIKSVNDKKTVKPVAEHLNLPQISIMQPSNNTSINKEIFQIKGKSSSSTSIPLVSWSIDNSPTSIATGTVNWSFTSSYLTEGAHTIHINALDQKGNQVSKSIKVTIDLKPPMLSITSPTTEDDSLDHISSINGTASDDNAISSVKVLVDNQDTYKATYSNGIWSAPVKLYAGTHDVKSIAIDKAGNSVTSRDVYFSLLNPKPSVMLQNVPYAQTSPSTITTSDVIPENSTQSTQSDVTAPSNANLDSNNGASGSGNSQSNNGFSSSGSSHSSSGSNNGGSSHSSNSHSSSGSDNGSSHSSNSHSNNGNSHRN